jgi:hypothetical protein
MRRGEVEVMLVSELQRVRACNAAGESQWTAVVSPVQRHIEVHTIHTTDLFCDENDAG